MESKQVGDSSLMHSDMEQELLFIYQSSDQKEVKTAKVLQLLDQLALGKSTQP